MNKLLKTLSALLLCVCLSACSAKSDYAVSAPSMSGNAAAKGEAAYFDNGPSTDSFVQEEVGGEKYVYTGSLNVETLDFDTTVTAVKQLIQEKNGIKESEELDDYDSSWMYSGQERTSNRSLWMTIRIPTENFDDFMNAVGEIGKVTSRSSSVENITRTYNDNATEIESLKIQEERLLAMLEEAQSVEDMITIESRLSDVQTQLKQKVRYQNEMDTDVEYSTVDLVIREVQKYTPVNEGLDTSDFFGRLWESVKYAGTFTLWFIQMLILGLVRYLPVGAILFAIVYGLRRLLERRRKKKETVKNNTPEEKK